MSLKLTFVGLIQLGNINVRDIYYRNRTVPYIKGEKLKLALVVFKHIDYPHHQTSKNR